MDMIKANALAAFALECTASKSATTIALIGGVAIPCSNQTGCKTHGKACVTDVNALKIEAGFATKFACTASQNAPNTIFAHGVIIPIATQTGCKTNDTKRIENQMALKVNPKAAFAWQCKMLTDQAKASDMYGIGDGVIYKREETCEDVQKDQKRSCMALGMIGGFKGAKAAAMAQAAAAKKKGRRLAKHTGKRGYLILNQAAKSHRCMGPKCDPRENAMCCAYAKQEDDVESKGDYHVSLHTKNDCTGDGAMLTEQLVQGLCPSTKKMRFSDDARLGINPGACKLGGDKKKAVVSVTLTGTKGAKKDQCEYVKCASVADLGIRGIEGYVRIAPNKEDFCPEDDEGAMLQSGVEELDDVLFDVGGFKVTILYCAAGGGVLALLLLSILCCCCCAGKKKDGVDLNDGVEMA